MNRSTVFINIDLMIERQAHANEAAHLRFPDEDQLLLTARVLMNGALQKTNAAVEAWSVNTVKAIGRWRN